MTAAPSRLVESRDGTPIAVFTSGAGPPIVLVHGAAADHTTFRVIGPMLAERVHGPCDRPPRSRRFGRHAAVRHRARVRGRGGRRGRPRDRDRRRGVDVIGHSYGGRCALGAARLTDPSAGSCPTRARRRRRDVRYGDATLADELADARRAGRPEARARSLHAPRRRAWTTRRSRPTAPTRSGRCGSRPRTRSHASWPPRARRAPRVSTRSARVRQPVLQVLGGDSLAAVRARPRSRSTSDSRTGGSWSSPGHATPPTTPIPDAMVEAIASFLVEP